MLGLEVAEGADRPGELADAEVFGGGVEADEIALHLGVPEQQLQAEGSWFGVDAVGAADDGRVLELEGAGLEDFAEAQRYQSRMMAEASLSCSACAVSTTSVEVRP